MKVFEKEPEGIRIYQMDKWLGYADDTGVVTLKSVFKPHRTRTISRDQWEMLPVSAEI